MYSALHNAEIMDTARVRLKDAQISLVNSDLVRS